MTPPAVTPDPLEAAIAAWVPEEATLTVVDTVTSVLLETEAVPLEVAQQVAVLLAALVSPAFMRAVAPLLAEAVEAAIQCDGVAHDMPGALCANCGSREATALDPDRLAAFRAVLTQAKK